MNPDLKIVKTLLEHPKTPYTKDKNNLILLFLIGYGSSGIFTNRFSSAQEIVAQYILDQGYIHDINGKELSVPNSTDYTYNLVSHMNKGNTLLHLSYVVGCTINDVEPKNKKYIAFLLKNGANVNIKNNMGFTPEKYFAEYKTVMKLHLTMFSPV